MKSIKWQLNTQELSKICKNAVIFFSPVILLYLGSVYANIKLEGFQITDFIPDQITITAIMLWLVNTGIDVVRKFSQGK